MILSNQLFDCAGTEDIVPGISKNTKAVSFTNKIKQLTLTTQF